MLDLKGKVILISGGARGQGEADGRLFVELGAQVVLADILDDSGRAVAAELGSAAAYVHLDVTQPQDWRLAVANTVERFGRLDVLVNNAGIVAAGALESQSLDDYMRIIMVNQVGCFLGMQAVIPQMRAVGGGSIVNVASINAVIASPVPLTAYTASKFAMRGMTKSAAIELGPLNIRVNTLIPGAILTPMNTGDPAIFAAVDRVTKRQPIARFAQPRETAQMVAFLASDASAFCTGADFVVDGGVLAGSLRDT
jgi:3alpha(or 20beta)-hydroxysteroid dehydrogenase